MINCPNCGALIDENVTKCPHCGFINIEGAEKKFQEDIEDIKENIKEVKKQPIKAFGRGLSKGVKVILWTAGIVLVLAGIMFAILLFELRNHPKEFFLTAEDKAYEAAYKVTAGEELEDAFSDKDIARMARIYDKAYSEDRVKLWGINHYETSYAASCYMKLQDCLPNLDKDNISKREAEEITYYCFYFYYRAYGEDGAEIFDSIREDEIIPIINNRLGFSIEDMENFKDKVMSPPNVNRTNVYKATKKYFKNYH